MLKSFIPRARYVYNLRDTFGLSYDTWVAASDTIPSTYDVWGRVYTDDIDRESAHVIKIDMSVEEIESCGIDNHTTFLQKVADKIWKKI